MAVELAVSGFPSVSADSVVASLEVSPDTTLSSPSSPNVVVSVEAAASGVVVSVEDSLAAPVAERRLEV